MNIQAKKLKVTEEMIEVGFLISRRVFRGELVGSSAQAEFMVRFNLPKNRARTADGYWQCYWYLLTRRKIRNIISEAGWRYNLEKISTEGHAPLMTALNTFMEHIVYLKGINNDYPALYRVHGDFTERLKAVAEFDAVSIELDDQVRRSLRDSAEERTFRLQMAPKNPEQLIVLSTVFRRNPDVIAEALSRANGMCQGCHKPAPFSKPSGESFLEVHHQVRLADGGLDTIDNAIALCPNCHRERHYGAGYAVEDREPIL